MKNSSVQGKDQQHQMIMKQDNAEGAMENKEEEETIIETTMLTDRMKPQKKRQIGSMHSLVGNTKDNTFGVSVERTSMVTIGTVTTEEITEETKATREITEETREIRAIQMEATATRGSHRGLIPVTWMSMGT